MHVMLIDSAPLVRQAMRSLAHQLAENVVISEIADALSFVQSSEKITKPDLIIFNSRVQGRDSCDLVVEIRRRIPDVAIAVFCDQEDVKHIVKTKFNGARGFIPKTSPPKLILNALRLILEGAEYFPSSIINAAYAGDLEREGAGGLSARQRRVLELTAAGESNADIASRLEVSVATIKGEMQRVIHLFKAQNRTHAVAIAAKKGAIELP